LVSKLHQVALVCSDWDAKPEIVYGW
jgi:hypothetical protein